jgi:hypothetical protein
MRLILRDGSCESSSSSVRVRSSDGNVRAYACVKERIACVFVRAKVVAVESAVADGGCGCVGSKCARTRAEKRSPTPEK